MAGISWGLPACCREAPRTLVAYMQGPRLRVKFWQDQDKWQVEQQSFIANSQTGRITPDGHSLLSTLMDACNGITLCQHAFSTSESAEIAGDMPPDPSSHPLAELQVPRHGCVWPETLAVGCLKILWNPLPSSWSGLYAFQHARASQGRGQSVTLVDARAHKVLGSWSGADLAVLLRRRASRKDDVPQEVLFSLMVTRRAAHGRILQTPSHGVCDDVLRCLLHAWL